MNYKNLAKLCKDEADNALGEMAGSTGGSEIISRLAGILLAVSAVLDDSDDNKSTITYRDFMENNNNNWPITV